jgi:hypothetical protein
MKIATIPSKLRRMSRDLDKQLAKGNEHIVWWRLPEEKIPEQGILTESTGDGIISKGVTVYLIDGHKRKVNIDGKSQYIYEWVGLLDEGSQPLVQLGRDVDLI